MDRDIREKEIFRRIERGRKKAMDQEVRETLKIKEIEEINRKSEEREAKRAQWQRMIDDNLVILEIKERVKGDMKAEEDKKRAERAIIEEEKIILRNRIVNERKQRVIDVLQRQNSFDPSLHDLNSGRKKEDLISKFV